MSKINNPSQTTNKNGFSSYIWNVDVKGIALPIYIGIILILICIMAIGKLPHNCRSHFSTSYLRQFLTLPGK